jgi:hypothetical protein
MSRAIVSKLVHELDRAKHTLARNKEKVKLGAERTMHAGLGVLGGAAVGAARSKFGEGVDGQILIPGIGIDADAVLGATLIILGVSGYGGRQSDSILAIGTGVTAAYAGFEAKKLLDARKGG